MQQTVDKGPATVALEERIEAIPLPVSDIDRAKQFYEKLGWRVDVDFHVPFVHFRTVQITPRGSPCSIQIGTGLTAAAPGSLQGLLLVVKDVEAARADIMQRGIDIGEVYHVELGKGPEPGADPQRRSYSSFVDFKDPDGNGWRLQEITQRLPGRGGGPPDTSEQKIEAIPLPVSDLDRAKQFYEKLGWQLDIDYVAPAGDFRVIQFTPPGSQCSIQFGGGRTTASPGSVQGLLLVVKDIEAARADIVSRGIEIGDVYHSGLKPHEPGPALFRLSYLTYADLNDPDGNSWRLQEITHRFPGR
jgi:catechol 2,3-dioxygenase-like lactoylglutathione lyase family enzyme